MLFSVEGSSTSIAFPFAHLYILFVLLDNMHLNIDDGYFFQEYGFQIILIWWIDYQLLLYNVSAQVMDIDNHTLANCKDTLIALKYCIQTCFFVIHIIWKENDIYDT